jgi:hypothetical protein
MKHAMTRVIGAVVLFALMSSPATRPAQADGEIAADVLARLKGATVFLSVRDSGVTRTGTGFAIRREGEWVVVATNHHVVAGLGRSGSITAVFNPGPSSAS